MIVLVLYWSLHRNDSYVFRVHWNRSRGLFYVYMCYLNPWVRSSQRVMDHQRKPHYGCTSVLLLFLNETLCVRCVNQGSIIFIHFWKNENETQFRNEVGIRFNIFVYTSVTFGVLERAFCTRLRHMFEDYIHYRYVIIQVFGTKTTSMYLYISKKTTLHIICYPCCSCRIHMRNTYTHTKNVFLHNQHTITSDF